MTAKPKQADLPTKDDSELCERIARIIGGNSGADAALREKKRRMDEGEEAGIFMFNGTWIVWSRPVTPPPKQTGIALGDANR